MYSEDIVTDMLNIPEDESLQATQSIVVNELFASQLYKSPSESIGHTMWEPTDSRSNKFIRTTIVGVVPNIILRSIHYDLTPMAYQLHAESSGAFNRLTIAVAPQQMTETITAIESLWAKHGAQTPIHLEFLDQNIAQQYNDIEKRAQMFGVFAVFAVFIACLGLFGLASFSTERRTKEIGVRKALGASVLDKIQLLMWQFSKPVLLANIIAWPVAYFVMARWLDTFKHHIDINDPLFLLPVLTGAGCIAMLIALATITGQAARVARASPVHALRCE